MKIFDGNSEAEKIKLQLAKSVARLSKKGQTLGIAFLVTGDDPAITSYVSRKTKLGKELGISIFEASPRAPKTSIATVKKWNSDKRITGIVVQLPLPKGWPTQELVDHIDPRKDVDGLTSTNQAKLYQKLPTIVPATPRAVMKILELMKVPIAHKHAVVIGHSTLVGRPTAQLLLNADATVTVVHKQSWHIERVMKTADIVVSAAGVPGLVKPSMIKRGATVIDVGITKHKGKLVGDVSPQVASVAGRFTPVPGGVGPMTIVMLYANLLELLEP